MHKYKSTSGKKPSICRSFPLTQSHGSDGEQNEQVPLQETLHTGLADGAHPLLHAACSPLHGPA